MASGSEVTITIRGRDEATATIRKIQDELRRLGTSSTAPAEQGFTRLENCVLDVAEAVEKLTKVARDNLQEVQRLTITQTSEVVRAIRGIGEAQEDNREETEKAGEAWEKFAARAMNAAAKVRASILAIGEGLGSMGQALGTTVGGMLSGLGGSIGKIGSGGLGGNILSGITEKVRDAIVAVTQGAVSLFKGATSLITGFLSGALEMAGKLASSLTTLLGGGLGLLFGGKGGLIGGVLGSVVGAIPQAAAEAAAGFVRGFGAALTGAADFLGGVVTAGVNIAAQALNGLVTVAQGVVERVGSVFSGLLEKVTGIFGEVASKGALAFTGLVAWAAKGATDTEKELALAFALIPDAGEKAFKELRAVVSREAARVPFMSGGDVAKGLFQAITSGAREPAQAEEVLSASLDAAVGGNAELAQVVRALTKVQQLYNGEVRETADLMFQTQNVGQITFGEVAQGIGSVIGFAKVAKLELADLMKAIAAGSRVLDPESTFTGAKNAIISLAASSPDAIKAMDRLGVSFKNYTKEERAAVDAAMADLEAKKALVARFERMGALTLEQRNRLKDLRDEVEEGTIAFEDLQKASGQLMPLMDAARMLGSRGFTMAQIREIIPEKRAAAFILALSQMGDKLDEVDRLMDEFSGSTAKALELQTQTIRGQLSLAWGQFRGIVGDVVREISPGLQGAFATLSDKMREFRASPVFAEMVVDIREAVSSMYDGIGRAFLWLRDNWNDVKEVAREVWEGIRDVAVGTFNLIRDAASGVDMEGGFLGKLRSTWESLKATALEFRDAFRAAAEGDLTPLKNALGDVWAGFEEAATRAWEGIRIAAISALADVSMALGQMLSGLGTSAGGGGAGGGGTSYDAIVAAAAGGERAPGKFGGYPSSALDADTWKNSSSGNRLSGAFNAIFGDWEDKLRNDLEMWWKRGGGYTFQEWSNPNMEGGPLHGKEPAYVGASMAGSVDPLGIVDKLGSKAADAIGEGLTKAVGGIGSGLGNHLTKVGEELKNLADTLKREAEDRKQRRDLERFEAILARQAEEDAKHREKVNREFQEWLTNLLRGRATKPVETPPPPLEVPPMIPPGTPEVESRVVPAPEEPVSPADVARKRARDLENLARGKLAGLAEEGSLMRGRGFSRRGPGVDEPGLMEMGRKARRQLFPTWGGMGGTFGMGFAAQGAGSFGEAGRSTFGGADARQERLLAMRDRLSPSALKEARGLYRSFSRAGVEVDSEAIMRSATKGGLGTKGGRQELAGALDRQSAALKEKSQEEGDSFAQQAEKAAELADALRAAKDEHATLLKEVLAKLEESIKAAKEAAAKDREARRRVNTMKGKD